MEAVVATRCPLCQLQRYPEGVVSSDVGTEGYVIHSSDYNSNSTALLMNTRLRQITDSQFFERPEAEQVIVHENARRFAELSLSGSVGQSYVRAWASDHIEPVSVCWRSDTWVGVDQRAVCIDARGRVAFAASVACSLLDIKPLDNCIAILCDAELLLVNTDYTVRRTLILAEVPDSVIVEAGRIIVVGVDGRRIDAGAAA